MTAFVTFSPRCCSAASLIFWRIIAEISGGEYIFPSTETRTSPLLASTTLYGTIFCSSLTSENFRPMKRLIEKMVFSGLVTACRLATWPTSRSLFFAKATTDGVVLAPSGLARTEGLSPSITATTELVVPRSMPMILPTRRPPIEKPTS